MHLVSSEAGELVVSMGFQWAVLMAVRKDAGKAGLTENLMVYG